MAYAKRVLGGQGITKKQIALDSGFSSAVSNSVKSHIEDTAGFNNAMTLLAIDSNNLALAAMHEFKSRGFQDFSNKELVGALNAIGNAWSKFNQIPNEKKDNPTGNKLKTVILQQIENQTVQMPSETPTTPEVDDKPASEVVDASDGDKMDF